MVFCVLMLYFTDDLDLSRASGMNIIHMVFENEVEVRNLTKFLAPSLRSLALENPPQITAVFQICWMSLLVGGGAWVS